MLHHERLKPPAQDYPPNEWSVIEKNLRPEFMAQMETVLALGNGYFGMRGVHEEGRPYVQNGTFVNGFYESWPIIYGEEAFGFARLLRANLRCHPAWKPLSPSRSAISIKL
jgi:alpha,alpha-trehalose phosphorylase